MNDIPNTLTGQARIDAWKALRKERQRAAADARKRGNVVAGVDLDAALAAYRRFPPFKGRLGALRLYVAHSALGVGCKARAYTRRRIIRVTAGTATTKADALEVLVHELAHMALPPGVHHGERFRLTLRRAALELWGIDCPIDVETDRLIAYGMDEVISARLTELIEDGAVETFPAAATPEKPSRAARVVSLVERRATHAAIMLLRAERKAKLAQRTLTKWRAKVRYYERTAAKKSGGSS
jgi:hypothetical protein